MKRRIGLFGGSFDPPHEGHLALVEAAQQQAHLDEVWVLVSARPPHKQHRRMTPAGFRLALAQRAFAHQPKVTVLDWELNRFTPSYTYQTLEEAHEKLREQRIEADLCFIVGADSLIELDTWKEPERLLQLATLLVARRPGYDEAALKAAQAHWQSRVGAQRIVFFDAPLLPVSSTQIRQRWAAYLGNSLCPPGVLRTASGDKTSDKARSETCSETCSEMCSEACSEALSETRFRSLGVPEACCQYLLDHGLYADADWGAGLSDQVARACAIHELKLRQSLSPARYEHSLSVYYLAVLRAAYWGLSVDQVAQAALLHDCAKQLPLEQMRELVPDLDQKADQIPAIYHAYAGAVWAQNHYGVQDPAVLDAIREHATLEAGSSPLAEWVFLCDKLEPTRTDAEVPEFRLKLAHGLTATAVELSRRLKQRTLASGGRWASSADRYIAWVSAGKPMPR